MKFDFVIGNPPYQEDRCGDSTTALPVYHSFMDAAYSIGQSVELITPARFLFDAGRTPKEWNNKMLHDNHLKVLKYEENASKIFSNTDIKGGVAITYRDAEKDFGCIGIFTAYKEINMILKRIVPKLNIEGSFSSMCFVASKFNTGNLFKDFPQYCDHERRMSSNVLGFVCFSEKPVSASDIGIYGVEAGKRVTRYIARSYVDLSETSIQMYKIVTPKADGNGSFGEVLTNPIVLGRNTGFTHTFLGIGGFEKESYAISSLKYIKTKFVRCMLGILKITQDLNADKWKYVPLQDFTSSSDIDWSLPIPEIDQQLYAKYGLSPEEIEFIETHVKEMK